MFSAPQCVQCVFFTEAETGGEGGAANTKQETVGFTVNTSPLLGLSYTELAVITAAIIIAAIGTGTYLLKTKKKS